MFGAIQLASLIDPHSYFIAKFRGLGCKNWVKWPHIMKRYFLWEMSTRDFHYCSKRTLSIYLSVTSYKSAENIIDTRFTDLLINHRIHFQQTNTSHKTRYISQSKTLKHINNNSNRKKWKRPNGFFKFCGTNLVYWRRKK